VVPVFDTVEEAVRATDANAALICTPADGVADAVLESADANLPLIVCVTANVPEHDMLMLKRQLAHGDTRLIGPGSPGVFSPGHCLAGVIPQYLVTPGPIGVVTRSGSLAYEVTWQLSQAGFGQSTVLVIGGGMVVGTGFVSVLAMFEDDPLTEQVVLVGEVGGGEEQAVAAWVTDGMTKPVVAYIAGQTAPPGRQMGHPGAVIEQVSDTAQSKIDALRNAGVRVARTIDEVPKLLQRRNG